MADQSEETIAIPLESRRTPEFKLYFSNNVQVSAGQSDEVQIFFGQIPSPMVAAEPPKSIVLNQEIGIVMTLTEFKRVVELFQNHLPRLEKIAALQKASLNNIADK